MDAADGGYQQGLHDIVVSHLYEIEENRRELSASKVDQLVAGAAHYRHAGCGSTAMSEAIQPWPHTTVKTGGVEFFVLVVAAFHKSFWFILELINRCGTEHSPSYGFSPSVSASLRKSNSQNTLCRHPAVAAGSPCSQLVNARPSTWWERRR